MLRSSHHRSWSYTTRVIICWCSRLSHVFVISSCYTSCCTLPLTSVRCIVPSFVNMLRFISHEACFAFIVGVHCWKLISLNKFFLPLTWKSIHLHLILFIGNSIRVKSSLSSKLMFLFDFWDMDAHTILWLTAFDSFYLWFKARQVGSVRRLRIASNSRSTKESSVLRSSLRLVLLYRCTWFLLICILKSKSSTSRNRAMKSIHNACATSLSWTWDLFDFFHSSSGFCSSSLFIRVIFYLNIVLNIGLWSCSFNFILKTSLLSSYDSVGLWRWNIN